MTTPKKLETESQLAQLTTYIADPTGIVACIARSVLDLESHWPLILLKSEWREVAESTEGRAYAELLRQATELEQLRAQVRELLEERDCYWGGQTRAAQAEARHEELRQTAAERRSRILGRK